MTEAVTAAGWLLLHGTPNPPPERIMLHAGPVAAEFVPDLTHLRRIRIGDREILRGIYAAVRDRNWGTIPQKVRITERKIEPDSFRIAFEADAERGDIRFGWKGTITGSKDGTITYTFDGEAKTTFKGNRIGLLALHPPATVAGKPAEVGYVDAISERLAFPDLISTEIPFNAFDSLSYDVAPGLTIEASFRGDTFGTEDQRNWTDDSFKTYSMMHGAQLPAEFKAGTKIRQSIKVQIIEGAAQAPATPGPVMLDTDPKDTPAVLPAVRTFDPATPVPRSFEGLNFDRPVPPPAVIAFSAHPQIHQFDDETILENAATLGTCVRTIRSFAPQARIVAGPLALNPPGSPADPRHGSLLCAAWTLSALKSLAEAGADEAVFFEPAGPRGLHHDGKTFPCAHILMDATDSKGWQVVPARSTRPLESVMLLLERNGAHRALVANLTPNPVAVRIVLPGSPGSAVLRRLDLSTIERAMAEPDACRTAPGEPVKLDGGSCSLTLDRYACLRLDVIR